MKGNKQFRELENLVRITDPVFDIIIIIIINKAYLLFKTSLPVQAISPNAYMFLGNTYNRNIDVNQEINCIHFCNSA